MSPLWLARKEPYILSQPIGHDKVPMIFWGPFYGPGAAKKKGRLLRSEILKVSSLRNCLILFFSVALILMGAWQQIN
jgi:hypothetical protein